MLKNLFLPIAAIGIVTITATAKAGQPLDHLTWDNWGIDIYQVGYTSQVPATVSNKEADEASLFIRVDFTVKNLDRRSHPFSPRVNMKLLWDGREYDGQDIDPGLVNLDWVEPSVIKTRAVYFEVPAEAKWQSVVIRFHDDGFFGLGASGTQDVSINFANQKPAPTPVATRALEADNNPKTTQASNPAPDASPALPDPTPMDLAPLTDEMATAAFNALQDRFHRPHAKVHYDAATDSYRWIGPRLHKPMSISRKAFNEQIYKDYTPEAGAGKSISHKEATRNANDADPYGKLTGQVALAIEAKVNWTGNVIQDADAALAVFKEEFAKIDLSTAPPGLTGQSFDPEEFQVLVGNILARDTDPYDLNSYDKQNDWTIGFNNEFRKGIHNKQVNWSSRGDEGKPNTLPLKATLSQIHILLGKSLEDWEKVYGSDYQPTFNKDAKNWDTGRFWITGDFRGEPAVAARVRIASKDGQPDLTLAEAKQIVQSVGLVDGKPDPDDATFIDWGKQTDPISASFATDDRVLELFTSAYPRN
jgi:hypothetical protein